MRSKEVEKAIVKLDIEKDVLRNSINRANYDEEYREVIDLEDFKELKQAIDTVLNYISEKEKENKFLRDENNIYKNETISKSVIRDKIKELDKEIEEKHKYGLDLTIIHEHEIDTNGIIEVLKELLEGE